MVFGVYENPDKVGIGDALLIALIAIVIVFLTIVIIILVTTLVQKGTDVIESKTNIMPKEANRILERDPDAVAAVLVATIDFHKETGKGSRILSVTRIDE